MRSNKRMILALAAETDDRLIWERIKTLQTEMFAAGPVAIKFATSADRRRASDAAVYHIALGHGCRRHGRASWTGAEPRCVCGCYVQVGDILERALQETRQGPVQAVVIVGDYFHGDLDDTVATAKQLRTAGTRLFLFQQGRSGPTDHAFRMLAEVTGGAYLCVQPAHRASGGTTAADA